ncbi:MAG: phosphomannose isomerase type II C-terminal cupin domain [Candidatus Aenigmatarchaeota archaeon]
MEVRRTKWGLSYLHSLNKDGITIKTLILFPNECTSLQYHNKRFEFWHAIKPVKIVKEDREIILGKQDFEIIPKNCKHRLMGLNSLSIITEISFGEFSEEDIVRLEDKYGRG